MIRRSLLQLWGEVGFARLRTLSFVTVSHAFIAVAFFAQTVALARILSVEEFGRLATLLAIATVIEAAIAARGSETALAAFSQTDQNDTAARLRVASLLLRIDFVWCIVLYGLVIAILPLFVSVGGDRLWWLALLLVGSMFGYPWGAAKAYLTLFKGPTAFPLIEMTYAAITCFVGCALTWLMGGLGFVIGMMLASLTRSLLALRQAELPLSVLWRRGDRGPDIVGRSLVLFGVTGTLRAALLNFANQMDVLLLSAAGSPAAVGLYRSAKTLSGMVQKIAQPLWFVLKGHIISGSRAGSDFTRSVRMIGLAGILLGGAGVLVIPVVIIWGADIVELAFGPRYRQAADALAWLVPGAWALFAITGWSALFGSVSRSRATVIGIYAFQVISFGGVALWSGITPTSVAMALALSQIATAVAFWMLLCVRRVTLDAHAAQVETS